MLTKRVSLLNVLMELRKYTLTYADACSRMLTYADVCLVC
jgi:hypothetical protein